MTSQLKSHTSGNTLILTISDPENLNAMSTEVFNAGVEALNAADSNPEIKCVIITGEGSHFCAGGNLSKLYAKRDSDPSQISTEIDCLHNWMDAIKSFSRPVIAAVEGAAAGAGFSLALMCDLIVSSEEAVFATSYTNVALSPDGGASWNLTRTLPRQLAFKWLALAERIKATELAHYGLIHSLVKPGQALPSALALAEKFGARAQNAMSSVKELVNAAAEQDLSSHLHLEREHFIKNIKHANAGIGIQAFLNKQKPDFQS
jgi:enoyl-CoA hydratase/carnithine racemase